MEQARDHDRARIGVGKAKIGFPWAKIGVGKAKIRAWKEKIAPSAETCGFASRSSLWRGDAGAAFRE